MVALAALAACSRGHLPGPAESGRPDAEVGAGHTAPAHTHASDEGRGTASPVPANAVLADSARVVWRADVGPSLFAAPVVVGSAVVVAGGDGRVRAISASTGRRHWSSRLEGPLRSVVLGRTLLFTGADREDGHAYAVRLTDGVHQWARRLGTVRHAPAIVGDTIWVAADNGVHALHGTSGAALWSIELPAPAAPPVPVGSELLVATRGDTLYHMDRATGRITARVALPGRVSAAVLPWGGVVLVPLHSGRLLAYDAGARRTRWSAELGAPILASPVRMGSGGAYILTRSAELWHLPRAASEPRRLADLDGAAVGSLAVSGDHAIVGRLDGELIVVRPDGTIAWRQRLDDSIVAPVAVAGGAIYAPLLRGTVVKLEGAQ